MRVTLVTVTHFTILNEAKHHDLHTRASRKSDRKKQANNLTGYKKGNNISNQGQDGAIFN